MGRGERRNRRGGGAPLHGPARPPGLTRQLLPRLPIPASPCPRVSPSLRRCRWSWRAWFRVSRLGDRNSAGDRGLLFPARGLHDAVVGEIESARLTILVQAYSFTSGPIARPRVHARRRGVRVQASSIRAPLRENYTEADFLAQMGVPTRVDAQHAIAHNKVIIIDGTGGAYRFVQLYHARPRLSNAENLLVIRSPALARQYTANWQLHAEHSDPYAGRQSRSELSREEGGRIRRTAAGAGKRARGRWRSFPMETPEVPLEDAHEEMTHHAHESGEPWIMGVALTAALLAVLAAITAPVGRGVRRRGDACPDQLLPINGATTRPRASSRRSSPIA